MGTDESTQRVQTERDQEDLPVSEEQTERKETGQEEWEKQQSER